MNKRHLLLPLCALLLAGCGEQEKPASLKPATAIKHYAQATTLSGIVSNDKGVLKTGQVIAADEKGHELAQGAVDDAGRYHVEIPAQTALPLLLTYKTAEMSEPFISVVIDTATSQYPVNPLTTAIAKAAKAMGGYTRAHLVRAAEEKVNVPDANKTSSGWRGDPTTQYGGWH